MKINQYSNNLVQMFDRMKSKASDQDGGSNSNPHDQGKKKQDPKEEFEATLENVQQAIEDFTTSEMNQSHGISATQDGSGPGLKVTLRDSSGGILRSVSGEEFLKLREAIHSGAKSGRILDQKV